MKNNNEEKASKNQVRVALIVAVLVLVLNVMVFGHLFQVLESQKNYHHQVGGKIEISNRHRDVSEYRDAVENVIELMQPYKDMDYSARVEYMWQMQFGDIKMQLSPLLPKSLPSDGVGKIYLSVSAFNQYIKYIGRQLNIGDTIDVRIGSLDTTDETRYQMISLKYAGEGAEIIIYADTLFEVKVPPTVGGMTANEFVFTYIFKPTISRSEMIKVHKDIIQRGMSYGNFKIASAINNEGEGVYVAICIMVALALAAAVVVAVKMVAIHKKRFAVTESADEDFDNYDSECDTEDSDKPIE